MSEHNKHSEESRRLHDERQAHPPIWPHYIDARSGEQPSGDLFSEAGGALESYEAEPFGEAVDAAW